MINEIVLRMLLALIAPEVEGERIYLMDTVGELEVWVQKNEDSTPEVWGTVEEALKILASFNKRLLSIEHYLREHHQP